MACQKVTISYLVHCHKHSEWIGILQVIFVTMSVIINACLMLRFKCLPDNSGKILLDHFNLRCMYLLETK